MRQIVLGFSLLFSSIALSSVPHLPVYEVEDYSSVDRVVDGAKVILKGVLSVGAIVKGLEYLESCLDGMPEACQNVKEARLYKEQRQPKSYARVSTYGTHMPRQFARPFAYCLVGVGCLYVGVCLAKSAWRNFKQATSTPAVTPTYTLHARA